LNGKARIIALRRSGARGSPSRAPLIEFSPSAGAAHFGSRVAEDKLKDTIAIFGNRLMEP